MAPSPTKRGPFHSQMSCSDLLLISPRSVSARRRSLQAELTDRYKKAAEAAARLT